MKRSTTALQRLSVLAVCALFTLCAGVGFYHCVSRPPEIRTDADDPAVPEDDARPDTAPAEGRKEDYYTILLGGLDDENGGSDTNLLLALDVKAGTASVLSLPRDTLLDVSWTVKKLNNAYHHGGFQRTIEEVERLLGIPIDAYITVNLHAFVELVDAIGGVSFHIPVDMDYDDPYQDLHIHFPAGERHLSGEEALKVVRWRQNNDGSGYPTADIGRIGTQQAFLKAAAAQALSLSNLDEIPTFAEIFKTHVDTNLTLPNLIWLGEQILRMGSDAVSFYTLPGDGAGWYKGGSYYVLDKEAVLALMNQSFDPYTRPLTEDDLTILTP